MHELTELIRQDMCPALGVTEPGAIAFVVATARKHTAGAVKHITLRLNSGMFKNAFTCGIPNSTEVGNCHAAALGACGADPDKRLECLDGITAEQAQAARNMAAAGIIKVEMTEITSRIFIEAEVETDTDTSCVTIRDAHTNIVKITENGKTVYEKPHTAAEESHAEPLIHRYTLAQLHDYALTVPAEELTFIRKAFELNYALCQAGIASPKTTYARCLLEANDGQMISDDEQKTASLLCNAAIEARVLGLPEPAMSITGSGAHGIIATMPLYAYRHANEDKTDDETLWRATALSYLITMYIKEYSGRLSAFCGCGIAAGTGMACGLAYLQGADGEKHTKVIQNMASGLTGMICDGGNHGCTMKGIVAVDAAFRATDMAMDDICIENIHGINGRTPEATMKYMGMIASPGMTGTEKTIVEIMESKK